MATDLPSIKFSPFSGLSYAEPSLHANNLQVQVRQMLKGNIGWLVPEDFEKSLKLPACST
jgi:hypothetical protein